MPDKAQRANRAGAMARARAYVESGAFESRSGTARCLQNRKPEAADSLPQLRAYLTEEMVPAFARLGFASRIYDNPLPGQGPVLLASHSRMPACRP